MRLAEKGRYAPPPVLAPPHAEQLSRTLASWPHVHARTHWRLGDETVIDGADFYVGEEELGHLHLDGEAHVAVGRTLRDALVPRHLGRAFRWSEDFVTWPVTSDVDRLHAEWLFALRYWALTGASDEQLAAEIEAQERRPRARESTLEG